MQEKDNIIIKGKKEGLEILLPAKVSFDMIFNELQQKLEKNEVFFEGLSNVCISYTTLSVQNRDKLSSLLKDKLRTVNVTFADRSKKDNKNASNAVVPNKKALYLKETIRSGQRIENDGNIIILGDVNAGAEIIATGDILIMGTLRGLAHAGALGDEKSIVTAIQLQPVQLRIGSLIAVSPDKSSFSKYPEIACAKNGTITIEPLDK